MSPPFRISMVSKVRVSRVSHKVRAGVPSCGEVHVGDLRSTTKGRSV